MDNFLFPVSIAVTDQGVSCVKMSDAQKSFVIDFTKRVLGDFKMSGKRRIVFGITGPSGSGKSLLSVLVREIAKTINPEVDIEPVSIDAFHFTNDHLSGITVEGKSLKDAKGRYDTYDVPTIIDLLSAFNRGGAVCFPEYSRKLHEPIENVITVNERPTIIILEGLWLLRDEGGWRNVREQISKMFYLEDVAEESRAHTIARHVSGGRTPEDAERYYEESDAKNREMVLKTKTSADELLVWPK